MECIMHARRTGLMSRLFETLAAELKHKNYVTLSFLKEEAINKYIHHLEHLTGFELEFTKLYHTRTRWIWEEIGYEAVPVDFITEKIFNGIRITKKQNAL